MVSIFRNAFCWLLILALLTGCSGDKDKKSSEAGDTKTGTPGGEKPKPPDKPEFTLESVAFGEEFKQDEKKAVAKYKGRVVELTGVVKLMVVGQLFEPGLFLEGAKGDSIGAECAMRDRKPWKKVLPGQTVTLRGKVPDTAFRAQLIECEVIGVKGDPPQTLSADTLGKEYAKDREATKKKYSEKFLILEGEVEKVEAKDSIALVFLKTANETPRVFLHFTSRDDPGVSQLKAGQKVKAVGKFHISFTNDDHIGLFQPILMEPGV